MELTRQTTVRLIPAAILQPRIRLVDGDRLITGPAFSLSNITEEAASPSEHINVPVEGVIAQRVLYSFEASRQQLNRFNAPGDDGVYYAGTTLPASIAEIQWHLENPAGAPQFDRTRAYRAVLADLRGTFLDLRRADSPALVPDTATSYPEGRRIAKSAREGGWDGIIYPSARHVEGVCLAAFDRRSISSIRLGQMLAFEPYERDGQMRYGYRNIIPQHLVRTQGRSLTL
ncbi:RES family NAD+ phosphorylase [Sphingomonas sp. 3-13AW]|uniref:RES family NAD+ phosphorylase n=1 Tax=Sphingomonas sp. 3-13AW TaxID=3050450 RepID=UPI003BB65462